jgi:hypothetical protein
MTTNTLAGFVSAFVLALAFSLSEPRPAFVQCDGLDVPVVKAAQQADRR